MWRSTQHQEKIIFKIIQMTDTMFNITEKISKSRKNILEVGQKVSQMQNIHFYSDSMFLCNKMSCFLQQVKLSVN